MLVLNVLGGLYLTDKGRLDGGAASQPRRLAVLALLAWAGRRGLKREQILHYLWPDTDEERGRHALTQGLYSLRRDLGCDDLFQGNQELRLNPEAISSDYWTFQEAIRQGRHEEAVACYRGPFLEGFIVPGADNFERWADEERDALAHAFGRSLEESARRAMDRGESSRAVDFLRRRSALDPLNSQVAVRLMEALAAEGAVVEALQHARAHDALLKEELGIAADPGVAALAARIRSTPRVLQAEPAVPVEPAPLALSAAGGVTDAVALPADVIPALAPTWSRRALPVVAALAVVALAIMAFARWPRAAPAPPSSVIAIGEITDYSGRRPATLGPPLADMLAMNLARGSGYRVVSNTRMLELSRQLGGTADSSHVVAAAAREAGATDLVDGALYATAPNRYRLELRRVELSTGGLVRAYRVEGSDLLALVDSVALALVPDIGGRLPAGSFAQASTHSLPAYQAYAEGLQRFLDGDMPSAERRFARALELDSTFALAAYYYSIATTSGSRSETLQRLKHAVDLSRGASDRERLIIQAEWAAQNTSPTLAAIADTLMVRYPEEIDGYYFAGLAANLMGEYQRAEGPLRRVIELDSLGFRSANGGRCRLCEAYSGLGYSYGATDSLRKLAELVHEFVRRYPHVAQARRMLASLYAQEGKDDSAFRALRVADSLEPANPWNRRYLISVTAVLERYPETEQLIRSELRAAPVVYGPQASWDLAVILRQTGRLQEALAMARAYRSAINEEVPAGGAPYNALHEGQILYELGRYADARGLFDSIAYANSRGPDPSLRSRDLGWAWVHSADAAARMGDTARLRFLADSMEILGRGVAQARDQRLHYHVRGLLAQLQGDDAAAEAAFRRAIVSPVLGFTRSNYELAGLLIRAGRPGEAVPFLRSAMHGGTDGSTLYITRTELQARLATAFDSLRQADSAVHYYRRALKTWGAADPQFKAIRDTMTMAVARLSRVE